MKRFKLLLVLSTATFSLLGQGCSKFAPAPAEEGSDAVDAAAPVLRIDAPASALPGGTFEVDVSLRDASGNLLNATNPITVSLGSTVKGAVGGIRTLLPVNGVARFADLSLDTPAAGYTIVASSFGATRAISRPITVTWSEDAAVVGGKAQNVTLATAQPISPNVPMFGILTGGTQYYSFRAINGQLFSATTWANRLAPAEWDTSLRLRVIAADGTEIARSGATSPTAKGIDNGILALRIPADGIYFLACDSDPGGFTSGRYALTISISNTIGTIAQTEKEPAGATGQNDSMLTAQPLQPGLLYGHFDPPTAAGSAFDFYKIQVASAMRIRIDLAAARNGAAYGDALWDASLDLLDPSGAVLWSNDDTYSKDPLIDYVVTKAGTYFVRVGRSAKPGNTARSPYMLTFVQLPYLPAAESAKNTARSTAMPIQYGAEVAGNFATAGDHFFSFAGAAGDVVRLVAEGKDQLQSATLSLTPNAGGADAVLLGTDGVTQLAVGVTVGSSSESKLNLRQTILQTSGTYYVRVRSNAAGRFGLRLDRIAATVREREPNDTAALATLADPSGWMSGVIASAGDVDHFRIHAIAGQLVTVAAFAAPGGGSGTSLADFGSALMPTLQIRDALGNVLSTSSADRQGSVNFAETDQRPEEMVEAAFRAPATADYDVAISDADGQGGPTSFYALQVRVNQ